MKKSTKICLILSLVMLLAGVSLFVFALSFVNYDWQKLTTTAENETYDYLVAGAVQNIQIDTKNADIKLVVSPNTESSVQARVSSRDACIVEEDDGNLIVTCKDDPKIPWYRQILRQDDTQVTVYLPTGEYGTLDVKTDSGNVYVSDALSFGSLYTDTDSGDAEVLSPVSDTLSVTTESGEITVKGSNCKIISVESDSGTIFCQHDQCDQMSVKTSSGSVFLSKCEANIVSTNASSGDITMSEMTIRKLLDCISDSGLIVFNYSEANEIKIQTKSGNVGGTLEETMLFDVRSHSGTIDLPPSGGTHRCTIETDSGDVMFTLQQPSE